MTSVLTGWARATEVTIERKVTIPAGVDNDVQVRLAGEGEPGANGGPPGDCYCVIEISDHPFLPGMAMNFIARFHSPSVNVLLEQQPRLLRSMDPNPCRYRRGRSLAISFAFAGWACPMCGAGVSVISCSHPRRSTQKLSERAEELLRELAEEEQADVSPRRSSFLTRLAEYFAPESTENHPIKKQRKHIRPYKENPFIHTSTG